MKKEGIGVGVIILNDKNEILLLLRNSDAKLADSDMHLEGTYTLPSGKVMIDETLVNAAIRKVKDETNLEVLSNNLELISVGDDINQYAHYVTIGFMTQKYSGNFKLKDSKEFVGFNWFKLDNLPNKLCEPSKKIIENYLHNKIYN